MPFIFRNRRVVSVLFVLALFLVSKSLLLDNHGILAYHQEIATKNKGNSRTSIQDFKSSEVSAVCNIPTLFDLEDFFNYGKTNGRTSCTNVAEIGGNFRKILSVYPYNEGARIVCLDLITRGNCTVLSFGVGTDHLFDDQMADDIGCEVHMFDPTVAFNEILPDKMYYHNLGLHDSKQTLQVGKKIIQVDNYQGILQRLNLTSSKIDYLKIDIEGSEGKFFADVITSSQHLLDNVQQLAMEIHPIIFKKSDKNMTILEAFQPYWKAMHQLGCLGFDLISFVPNLFKVCKFRHEGNVVSGCYDLVYLRRPTAD